MRLLCFLFIITFYTSCKEKSINTVILERVNYFDSIGLKTFYNYQIGILREGKNSSFKATRFDTFSDYAIIKLNPKTEIEKNFIEDTIDINFVRRFKHLNCYYLMSKDSFVRMDFYFKKDRHTLYKGFPSKSIYLPFDTSKSIKIEKGWAYF